MTINEKLNSLSEKKNSGRLKKQIQQYVSSMLYNRKLTEQCKPAIMEKNHYKNKKNTLKT